MAAQRISKDKEEAVLRLYEDGLMYRQISELAGVGMRSIARIIERCKMRSRLDKHRQNIENVISLYNDGVSGKDIANQTGLKLPLVWKYVARYAENRRHVRVSNEFKIQVAEMNTALLTDSEIARRLNCKKAKVEHVRASLLKLPPRQRTRSELVEEYQQRVAKHGSLPSIRWKADRYEAWLSGSPNGLTSNQWRMHQFLSANGPMCSVVLAERLGISRSAVWKTLRVLIDKELVTVHEKARYGLCIVAAVEVNQHHVETKHQAGVPKNGDFNPNRMILKTIHPGAK